QRPEEQRQIVRGQARAVVADAGNRKRHQLRKAPGVRRRGARHHEQRVGGVVDEIQLELVRRQRDVLLVDRGVTRVRHELWRRPPTEARRVAGVVYRIEVEPPTCGDDSECEKWPHVAIVTRAMLGPVRTIAVLMFLFVPAWGDTDKDLKP